MSTIKPSTGDQKLKNQRHANLLAEQAAQSFRDSERAFRPDALRDRAWQQFLSHAKHGAALVGPEKFLTAFLPALGGIDESAYPRAVSVIRGRWLQTAEG